MDKFNKSETMPVNYIETSDKKMFSPIQRKIISFAVTGLSGLVLIGIVIFALMLLVKFVSTFTTVLWPIIIAMILALLLRPACEFLENYLKFSRWASALFLLFLATGILGLVVFLMLPILINEMKDFIQHIPVIWKNFLDAHPSLAAWLEERIINDIWVGQIKENVDFGAYLKSVLTSGMSKMQVVFGTASGFFSQIVAAAVVPIYFYYLITERYDLIGKLSVESKGVFSERLVGHFKFLMEQFRNITVAFFRGQLLVVFCYSIILTIGFLICGLQGAIFFGLFLGLLNLVPYLGTIIGLSVVLPLAFFSGGIWLLVGVIIVFIVAQLLEGYVFTPYIMKKQMGLHPMVIIISIFFWAIVFDGILGMVLAIPLTAFGVVFWRLAKKEYFS